MLDVLEHANKMTGFGTLKFHCYANPIVLLLEDSSPDMGEVSPFWQSPDLSVLDRNGQTAQDVQAELAKDGYRVIDLSTLGF